MEFYQQVLQNKKLLRRNKSFKKYNFLNAIWKHNLFHINNIFSISVAHAMFLFDLNKHMHSQLE